MVPCENYDDYLRIGSAGFFITRSPLGVHGVYQLAKRLGRPFLYLPPVCGEEPELPAFPELPGQMPESRMLQKQIILQDPLGMSLRLRKPCSMP